MCGVLYADGIRPVCEEFPEDLDKRFEEATSFEKSIGFSELPLDDYVILESDVLYSSKIDKEFVKLKVKARKDGEVYDLIPTQRFFDEFNRCVHKYFRFLGAKKSKKTGNMYFDFVLI